MSTITCIVCHRAVEPELSVSVRLSPAGRRGLASGATPFILRIASCCGRRYCIESAWRRARASFIGEVELVKLVHENDCW